MSGPKAVVVAPSLLSTVVPVLVVGGIAVVSVVALAGVAAAAVNTTSYAVNKTLEYINIKKVKAEIKDSIDQVNNIKVQINYKRFNEINILKDYLGNYEHLLQQAERNYSMYSNSNDIKELTSCASEIKNIASVLCQMKENLKSKIFELRDSFVRKVKAIENSKQQIISSSSLCSAIAGENKTKELNEHLKKLININIPDFLNLNFDFEHFDFEKIKQFQNNLNFAENQVKIIGTNVMEYIKKFDRQALDEMLKVVKVKKTLNINELNDKLLKEITTQTPQFIAEKRIEFLQNIVSSKYTTIDDLLNEKKNNLKPDEREKKLLEKASQLLAKFSELYDTPEYKELLDKFDNIKNEELPQRRLLLYDDFVVACSRLLKEDKRRSKILNELTSMKRQLIALNTPNVLKLVKEFENIEITKDISKYEMLKNKTIETVKSDVEVMRKKQMSEIIKEAFQETGYEAEEEFETMLVKNQKLYANKPSMKNYQVQVVSNSETSMMQLEVVRVVDKESELTESTKSIETRDIEVETEFCEDYKKILKKLEDNGIIITEKMHKKPGEIKVKKVLATSINKKTQQKKTIQQTDVKKQTFK